jgi:hypothetical protein
MRVLRGAVVAGLVCAFGLVANAAEAPPDDFVKAMKDLALFARDMREPGAEQDLAKASRYVSIIRDAFGVVGEYWTDRNGAGEFNAEIATTQEAIKAASDMGVAATLASPEGVAASVKDILERCQPCHAAHREKAPGGGFLIK